MTNRKVLATLTGAVIHTFRYDSAGRLIQIEDGDGNLTTIERDANGNPTAIIGPYGQRTILSVNAGGWRESVTNPAGEEVRLSYTTDGLLVRMTDPKGGVHRYTYELGWLVKDEDPAGGKTELVRTKTANGHQVTVTKAVDTGSGITSTYLVEDLPTGERRLVNTDCCGGSTVTVIRADGSRTVTYQDGTVVTTVMGSDPRFGLQAPIVKSMTIKTPSGLTYTQTAEREATLATPGDPLSLQALTDTVTINGHTYVSDYDATTRVITRTTPEGRWSVTTLDEKGRVILVETPGLAPVAFEYDSRGRLVTITEGTWAEARVSRIYYDEQGYIANTVDAMNRTTFYEYDAAGRVITEILPDGRRIPYTYDANGNVTSIVPPGKPAHTFTYTPVDLEETYNPPPVAGGGTNRTSYEYNLNRRPTLVTRPDGQTIGFEYDTTGRLVTLTIPTGEIAYIYDSATGNFTDIVATDGGALSYGYDGSLLTEAIWAGAVSGSVNYTYNNDFNLTSLAVNGADPVAYQYDRDGLLVQAGELYLNNDPDNGLLLGTSLGGVTDVYGYNEFGEIVEYVAQFDGSTLYAATQELDKLGRIISKTETVAGETHTYAYSYDLAGRLTDVYKDGVHVSHYTYDDNGNRLSHTTPEGTTTGTYDEQDRLLTYGGAVYEYTANGELLRKTDTEGTMHYVYDVLGNLLSVIFPDGTKIEYIIDGQSRRIGKKINGVLVQGFLYQNILEPVVELDGAGNVVARFIYGTRGHVPDYMIKDGVTYRIVSDYLGNVRLVVNVNTGQIVQQMEYDEFGNVILDTNPGFQPFGFVGGLYEWQTGLVKFGARDYNAKIGRWITKDPIGLIDITINLYTYCLNDPINSIDILGLKTIDLGQGWSVRIDPPHVPSDQKHIHVEKNGNEIWNQNIDGTPHHPNKIKGNLPEKIKEKIKDKTGWDTDNPSGKSKGKKKENCDNNTAKQVTTVSEGVAIGVGLYILWKIAEFVIFPPLALSPI